MVIGMKKVLLVLVTLFILAACAPEKPEVQAEPDDKIDEVIEKVGELVDVITEKESVPEPAKPEPVKVETPAKAETPTSRRIPESNPIIREDDLPQPIIRFGMDVDPTAQDPYIDVRKGAIRSDWGQGKIANAWKFDGRDAYIITSLTEVKALDRFTIVIWVKPGDLKKRSHIFWQGDENLANRGEQAGDGWGTQQEMHLSTGDELGRNMYAKEKLTFYLGDNERSLKITTPMSKIDWQHVAIVVKNLASTPTAELYFDAHSVGKSSADGKIVRDKWGRLFFGKAAKDGPQGDSDRDFAGMVDEFAIYDVALSADEITKLCRRQNGGKLCNGSK